MSGGCCPQSVYLCSPAGRQRMDFAVLLFSKRFNHLAGGEEDSRVSPGNTCTMNYSRELVLEHDCASARSMSQHRVRGFLGHVPWPGLCAASADSQALVTFLFKAAEETWQSFPSVNCRSPE